MADFHVGSGQTYTTLAAFATAYNGLGVADQDDNVIIHGVVDDTGDVTISRDMTATPYFLNFVPASGEGISSVLGPDGVIYPNASSGVATLRNTGMLTGPYSMTFTDLQILKNGDFNYIVRANYGTPPSAPLDINRCIVAQINSSPTSGGGIYSSDKIRVRDSYVRCYSQSATYAAIFAGVTGTNTVVTGCVIETIDGTNGVGIQYDYNGTIYVRNCVFINCNDEIFHGGNGTPTINASNNGTDNASLAEGTSNVVNVAAATEFVSSTDYRLKTGSSLIGAGTASESSGVDIFNATRSTYDIGADYFSTGGGGGGSSRGMAALIAGIV